MDRKALSMADVSFPPASAKSGLPPPGTAHQLGQFLDDFAGV